MGQATVRLSCPTSGITSDNTRVYLDSGPKTFLGSGCQVTTTAFIWLLVWIENKYLKKIRILVERVLFLCHMAVCVDRKILSQNRQPNKVNNIFVVSCVKLVLICDKSVTNGRFGSFFKSHILGCPTIVSMDPEINKYILMNEAKGLVPGYPQSMLDILGKCNIAAVHGSNHKYMRGALVALVSPSMIKAHLLPKIDDFLRSHLSNWDGKVIDIQQKTKEVCSIVKPPKSIF